MNIYRICHYPVTGFYVNSLFQGLSSQEVVDKFRVQFPCDRIVRVERLSCQYIVLNQCTDWI